MNENKQVEAAAPKATWWKEAVVYQVYPRSFKDSNGDGIGDLRGLISKLDYIKSLGVDVVWLNPIFASPNDDNGYDISDYEKIMSEFGSLQDFDELLKAMHDRGLKLVLDLVVNHSSDEHEWFKQSRSGRDNSYRSFYHWWPEEKGKPAKRYSWFGLANDAWTYDRASKSYYLHYFSTKQPDLNWENPELRKRIYAMMKFWFDKGIDGFRMDVIPFISKDTAFPPVAADSVDDWCKYYASGPHLHDYIAEMNREVLSKYDIMSVGEGIGITSDKVLDFVAPERRELNMIYHFDGVGLPYHANKNGPSFKLADFKKVYSRWDQAIGNRGWGTIYLGNHDQPRMVSRWGDDRPQFKEASSKMLTTFLLTMRGTPYYYSGDELGMSNIRFDRIEDYQDIQTLNRYKTLKQEGKDTAAYLENQKEFGRDNSRTPFQWDAGDNAGFSSAKPWLKINPNYKTVNVAAQDKDAGSTLNYFRNAVRLRKNHKSLVYGLYELVDPENTRIYAYTRSLPDEKLLVVLNFSADRVDWTLPAGMSPGTPPLLNNYASFTAGESVSLLPYQAVVVQVK
jgi:oligo-1,6-glucosidase